MPLATSLTSESMTGPKQPLPKKTFSIPVMQNLFPITLVYIMLVPDNIIESLTTVVAE